MRHTRPCIPGDTVTTNRRAQISTRISTNPNATSFCRQKTHLEEMDVRSTCGAKSGLAKLSS
eukprot:849050-Prorocentrum_minimum.AAC.3